MAKRKLKPGDGVIEGIENLKPGDGVDGYEYGADLNAEGMPLIDPGTGKTISIRTFHFKMNPDKRKDFPTDMQLVFNSHARQIQTILWGDGLIPLDGVSPRVIINKKKGFYNIFVPCEAKRDVVFMEKPKNLTEELARSSTPKATGATRH